MSLQDAKKLQELKERAGTVLGPRRATLSAQRPKAFQNFLNDTANYLQGEGFVIEAVGNPLSGIKANYKGLELSVIEQGNLPLIDNSDYAIQISLPQKTLLVYLKVNPGSYVEPAKGSTTEKLISDYENRVLPSLEALSDGELDGTYKLFYQHTNPSGTTIVFLNNAKEVIDKVFENY